MEKYIMIHLVQEDVMLFRGTNVGALPAEREHEEEYSQVSVPGVTIREDVPRYQIICYAANL